MWALERHDWGSLRALRSAREIPEAIESLLAASSEEGARQAYWRIDNSVVVQGVLYQAALPTLECLLTGLLRANSHARPWVLELILQIAAGTPAQSECDLGNAMLAEQCRRELTRAVATFIELLEVGSDDERLVSIDLLGTCALVDPSLVERVRWLLRRHARGERREGVLRLIDSTVQDLDQAQVAG